MIQELHINFGALTPEDYAIVFRRFTRADTQFVRNAMRDGDLEDACAMRRMAGVSLGTEETEADRHDRLRDGPI